MGFVGVWYCIKPPGVDAKGAPVYNTASIVLIGYCFFFALFMVGVLLRLQFILNYCGFVVHPTYKSFFLVL